MKTGAKAMKKEFKKIDVGDVEVRAPPLLVARQDKRACPALPFDCVWPPLTRPSPHFV